MSKEHSPSQPIASQGDIVALAQQYILNLYNQKNDPRLLYHSYRQTSEIARTVNVLAQANASVKDDWELAELGAWFVNAGYLLDPRQASRKSIEVAEKFLSAHQYPQSKKQQLLELLKEVLIKQEPEKPASQLLSDSIAAVRFGENFLGYAELLRTEMELLKLTDGAQHVDAWEEWLFQQLMKVRFYTPHGKMNLEPVVASNLLECRKKLDEKKMDKPASVEVQADATAEAPKAEEEPLAISVGFWAVNYHNHLRLSTIADLKAHAMIAINAILLCLIIGMLLYSDVSNHNPGLIMPAFLFITTGLASLVCAGLAVKPRVTSVVHEATPLEDAKRNIVFFGNFVSMEPENFKQIIEEVVRDRDLLQLNFTSDLYHLGKVLDEKFRYLSYCYTLFLFGFIASVLAFLLVLAA